MSELDPAQRDIRRASNDAQARARQQAAVAALGQRALAGGPPDELFEEAVEKTLAALHADAAAILELDEGGRTFTVRTVSDVAGVLPVGAHAGPDSQTAYTARVGVPVVADDLAAESRFRPAQFLVDAGIRATATVPIAGATRPVGVLAAYFKTRHAPTAAEVDFLQGVANSLGTALARLESESRARTLAAIVENSTDAIIATDLEGRITTWNRAAVEMYGWSEADAVGRPMTTIAPAEERSKVALLIETVLSGLAVRNREMRAVRKDGTEMSIALTLFPLTGPGGRAVGTAGISRDITETVVMREQAAHLEARLRQSERLEAIGQLAGGVAHDFNNMLAVIINYAEFVLGEVQDSPVREDVLEIRRAADRAAALTRQLLIFSRREMAKAEILDLGEVVRSAHSFLARSLGEHVELEISIPPGLWRVEADPGQLEQVLVNLAVNSRDAMPEGGRLTITAENVETIWATELLEPGRYVQLAVSDTGTGMTEEQLEHAFEPFFTTKPRDQGTGLGLASAYGTVQRAGGHIELESTLGVGTTVRVWLPAWAGRKRGSSTEHMVIADAAERPLRVLVVEDEPEVKTLICRILESNGCVVTSTTDPMEALRLVEDPGLEIDLVLTDVVMPGIHGPEMAREIRVQRPDVPVLFISGYTDDAAMLQGVRDADVAFLEKPFSGRDLLAAVEAAVGERSGDTP